MILKGTKKFTQMVRKGTNHKYTTNVLPENLQLIKCYQDDMHGDLWCSLINVNWHWHFQLRQTGTNRSGTCQASMYSHHNLLATIKYTCVYYRKGNLKPISGSLPCIYKRYCFPISSKSPLPNSDSIDTSSFFVTSPTIKPRQLLFATKV